MWNCQKNFKGNKFFKWNCVFVHIIAIYIKINITSLRHSMLSRVTDSGKAVALSKFLCEREEKERERIEIEKSKYIYLKS